MVSRSYPFHNLRARKLAEREFRPESSWFETTGDRYCPATDRVHDTPAVLQWRVDTNRRDRRYALGTLFVPNWKTGFHP